MAVRLVDASRGRLGADIVLVGTARSSWRSRRWRVTRDALPWLSRLEFLGTGYAGSDYLDLIVRRGHELEVVAGRRGRAPGVERALHLDHLPPASLAVALARSPPTVGRR